MTISVLSEFDAEATRVKVEHAVRDALEKLEALPTKVRVRIVDAIQRSGTGTKERLVVTPTGEEDLSSA